ncbi:GNAT family N-acetyltransferase [Pedobacter metabolipauper]|uniref:Acetyltransferase (GNAT) family protein n=1 Tax=Pedobacter metabolipauper TaxID=425513 RepID=A0A4R6SWZ9_9SPHI|nr:GNAT family N-acetyltransferase [Pedobacter metabolipauper]TDQ11034.1 acetyltransferase (GNAT) family protein [Pedobacter metabolipauper]
MNLVYKTNLIPDTDAIISVYRSSGINRPIDDPERIASMFANSNLVLTAWDGELLIGISRALTDFNYSCYLSDLAISAEYQKLGIGKKLVSLTKEAIGDQCMLLLVAAPEAINYYPKIGMDTVHHAFIIKRKA